MDRLNKEQYRASRSNGGISLVIAGAGTGKTKTLVEKVCSVIKYSDIGPENILILTFSRKAAQEIKERIKHSTGLEAEKITSGTFHSFCLGLLRDYAGEFLKVSGYKEFPGTLADDGKDDLVNSIIEKSLDEFMGMPVDVIRYLMENQKNLSKKAEKKLESTGLKEKLLILKEKFNELKRTKCLMEFEDMIYYAVKILKENSVIKEHVLSKFRYIMVDEFQDTSHNNFELINSLLCENKTSLFVVGDDFQNIYSFRGADSAYIIRMKKFFPDVKIFKLKINYRSRKEILHISNRFIKKNKNRTRKKLLSYKGKGGSVEGIAVSGFLEEIERIKDLITNEYMLTGGATILYRNNWQGNILMKHIGECPPVIEGRVKLMTIHASKGLEFNTVIIAGVCDSIIPDRSSGLEEERRLFYVALTRAMERLFIIYHKQSNGGLPLFARELGIF